MLVTVSFGINNAGLGSEGSGLLGYQFYDSNGEIIGNRVSSGIIELVPSGGTYGTYIPDDYLPGKTLVWDIEGTNKTAAETFTYATVSNYLSSMSPSEQTSGYFSDLISHGDLNWTTASGFATPEDVQVVVPEPVFSGSVEFNGVIDNQITINPTELNSSERSLIANAVRTELAPELANLDASISSRMSSGDIQTILNALPVAPDNAAITLIRKILTNKTQDLGDQFIVFEDDEVTPLGAFSWNSYTGERGELKPVGGD